MFIFILFRPFNHNHLIQKNYYLRRTQTFQSYSLIHGFYTTSSDSFKFIHIHLLLSFIQLHQTHLILFIFFNLWNLFNFIKVILLYLYLFIHEFNSNSSDLFYFYSLIHEFNSYSSDLFHFIHIHLFKNLIQLFQTYFILFIFTYSWI